MKELPLGKQNFSEIVEWDYLYIDKTRQIHELIKKPNIYFLSRPRRFGKSLTVSVLQHIFEGQEQWFKGLYIGEKTNWDWKYHPVLYLNFAKFGYRIEDLEEQLDWTLDSWSEIHGITLKTKNISNRFEELVDKICEQHKRVVILIDEYDKPLIDFITEIPKAKANQLILKRFFSPLKEMERKGQLRLLFVTGVSKFSHVSIFSDLNNLTDLTIDPLSNDLVGITKKEILQYLPDYLEAASKKFQISQQELLQKLKYWYDGYSWDGETFVYNPVSLFNFFRKKRFGNFWFKTGTPTFLVKIIQQKGLLIEKLEERRVTKAFFDQEELSDIDTYNLLFQTGYLTMTAVENSGKDEDDYVLGCPNEDVRLSFIQNLAEISFDKEKRNVINWNSEVLVQ